MLDRISRRFSLERPVPLVKSSEYPSKTSGMSSVSNAWTRVFTVVLRSGGIGPAGDCSEESSCFAEGDGERLHPGVRMKTPIRNATAVSEIHCCMLDAVYLNR